MQQSEILEIKNLLEKLFVAQGKKPDSDILADFVSEISTWKYPFSAVCAGIKSLYSENLPVIKVFHIRQAAELKIDRTESRGHCHDCGGCGVVSMYRDNGYSAAMGCKCSKGADVATKMGLIRWNGQEIQYTREGRFRTINKYFNDMGSNPGQAVSHQKAV